MGNGSGSFYIEETGKVSIICFLYNVGIYFILPMVLMLDDSSEYDAHIWSLIVHSICLRQLCTSRAASKFDIHFLVFSF